MFERWIARTGLVAAATLLATGTVTGMAAAADVASDSGRMWGSVWHDLNADGVHQPEEPPMPGLTMRFTSVDGPVAAVSDDQGVINTETVQVGEHHLYAELPEGFVFSPPNVGRQTWLDSDVLDTEGHIVTELTTTPSGTPDMPDQIGVGLVSQP